MNEPKPVDQAQHDVHAIAMALSKAREWDLEAEVIWVAMRYAKNESEMDIESCFDAALMDWDIY